MNGSSKFRSSAAFFFLQGLRRKAQRKLMHQEFNSKASLRFDPYQLEATRRLLRRLLDDKDDFLGNMRLLVLSSFSFLILDIEIQADQPFLLAMLAMSSWASHTDLKLIQNRILIFFWPRPALTPPWKRSYLEPILLIHFQFWSMYHHGFQVLDSKGMLSNVESNLWLC